MVSYSIDPKEYYILTCLEEIPILSIDPENHNVFFSEECRLQTPRKMAGSIFRRRGVAPTIKDGETVGATNRVSQLITVCIYIYTHIDIYIYNVYYINDGVFECI